MSKEVRYVRLLPHDPKAGLFRQRHSHRWKGQFYSFTQPGIWVKVDVDLAEKLALERQLPGNPNSQRVFDVCTKAEAMMLDKDAERMRLAKKAVVEPTVDTALDMSGRGDLSLTEVRKGRQEALEEAGQRGDEEDEKPPEVSRAPVRSKETPKRRRTLPKRASSDTEKAPAKPSKKKTAPRKRQK